MCRFADGSRRGEWEKGNEGVREGGRESEGRAKLSKGVT